MKALTDTLTDRVDAFLKESFSVERRDGGDEAEIAICEAIEVIIRRRRNRRLVHSRLPADIIHHVFSLALDLDRIHEPDLPLEVLEDHRKQLFRMRCVSATWNEFLVSGPRYWRAVNLRTPPDILKTNLQRAEKAPLCIYTIAPKERRRRTPGTALPSLDELPLLAFMGQVRTIRSNDGEFLPLWKELRQGRMPTLETLDLTAYVDWSDFRHEPVAEWLWDTLPVVRHVVAKGWQPLASVAWLGNLRSLELCRPTMLDMNMLRILGQCSNLSSLRAEVDGTGWNEEEPADSFPNISLPNLSKLELDFDVLQDIRHFVRRLDIPQSAQGSLGIVFPPQSEEAVEDLPHFVFPEGAGSKPPTNPVLHILSAADRVTYTAGTRSIQFEVPELTEEPWDLLENMLVVLQNRLNNPPLTVQIDSPEENQVKTLRRLANLNVQRIEARCINSLLDQIFAAIGSRHENLPSGTVADGHNWPFESLRELILERTDISLSQIARLVGIRHRYLRTNSKEWLKRITLVDCNLRGLSLPKTTQQLADIGVTLVAERCRHSSTGQN
ncbi:hypothetical protein FS837_010390 [Tulasnella sp. UAMH 9824]|nr:hypothetical protein FS837_010390 [Tulasnella sp. UAMH 9824]